MRPDAFRLVPIKLLGPNPVPKITTISPGATGPVRKLAALVTAPITGPDPAAIVRLTLTVSGATVVSEGTIAIDPVYLPGARPRGSADTVKLAGVVPDVGLTDSQLPPVADAEKSIVLPSVALMFTVCGVTVPSGWGVRANVAGEAANAIGA